MRVTNQKQNKDFNIPTTAFKHLVNLTDLDLQYNMISSFDPEVFAYLPKLETLNLSVNPLNISHSLFVHLKELKNLMVSKSQVDADVEESLRKSYKLTFFDF